MLWICLVPVLAMAVCCDLCTRKIPNPLIVSAAVLAASYQWSAGGASGLLSFAGGSLLPLLLLGVLHYFRMLGAGDIKLFMAVGGFLGTVGSLKCIALTFLAAGIVSAARLIRHRSLRQRFHYFFQYLADWLHGGKWTPYICGAEEGAAIHLSLSIAVSALLVAGGLV